MFVYRTINLDKKEPAEIDGFEFVHVKAKNDGAQTIILCDAEIPTNENIESLSVEEAQTILDAWITEENENPRIDETTGEAVLQSFIPLDAFHA